MAMNRVMELHQKVMNAAINQNITDEEYFKLMGECLDEMEKIGITEEDMKKIEADLAGALFTLSLVTYDAVS